MIVLFTHKSILYDDVVSDLGAIVCSDNTAKIIGIPIRKIPITDGKCIAYVNNMDNVQSICEHIGKCIVYNPNPADYGLDKDFAGVAIFVEDGLVWGDYI